MKALIFNSGMGTRIGDTLCHKSLLKLPGGETIFHRQVRLLGECGVTEFVVTTGHLAEQVREAASAFPYRFEFVHNEQFDRTNYIYSLHLARESLEGDVLSLHGDLVFDKGIVERMLSDDRGSLCLYNPGLTQPEKDFKCRLQDGWLREVSVNIGGAGCYAFQPLYKLTRHDMAAWLECVAGFVQAGRVRVYAEDALNTVLAGMSIAAVSYEGFLVDEVDTLDDLAKVAAGLG